MAHRTRRLSTSNTPHHILVAFGPDSTWVTSKNGRANWSPNLPAKVYNILHGRYDGGQRKHTALKTIAFTDDEYFIAFEDGKFKRSSTNKRLSETLDDFAKIDPPSYLSFCGSTGNSYIGGHNGRLLWCNIPSDMQDLLDTHRPALSVLSACVGCDGAWFLKFSDHHMYWGGEINDQLVVALESKPGRAVQHVYLSPFDDHYFVEFSDGTMQWEATEDFSNAIKADDHIDPHDVFYTEPFIKDCFSCGRAIHDVADDLFDGQVDPEDIPAIRVTEHLGKLYTLDNRRLWAFLNAQLDRIPIITTPPNNGFLKRLKSRPTTDDATVVRILGEDDDIITTTTLHDEAS
eukprot:m.30186 g.30186  ORF g.30186 m.30186 type:complete len:346 (+) comp16229_c0_seq1:420-1457(+)